MTSIKADENRRLAQTIEQRAGTGHSAIVAGWQSMLQDMLTRMQPFLKPVSIVTFQQLLPDEKVFFGRLVDEVPVPTGAQAFYLPPSVRHQMMGGPAVDNDDIGLSDAGVLVASRVDNHDVIVNALFARASCTPAVDVYERGKLVAGYQYPNIDACRFELGTILKRHLLQSSMSHQQHVENGK
jgi:hypothetical protein